MSGNGGFGSALFEMRQNLIAIVDYIHFNPVKHGYVSAPGDWPWSSFPRFVRSGHYPDH